MNEKQLTELLMQSLEHEKGGVLVYETALKCVVNGDLREEWEKYLDETRNHVRVLTDVCTSMHLAPDLPSPGRTIVHKIGGSLVAAMEEALASGPPEAAQLVACECVVLAETKDHLDWELLGKCAAKLGGQKGKVVERGVRGNRGPGGRAPVSLQGLVPGALDRLVGYEGDSTSPGRAQGGKDGDWCGPCRTGQCEESLTERALGRNDGG